MTEPIIEGAAVLDGVRGPDFDDQPHELMWKDGRPVVVAYNCTTLDLLDLLTWLRQNRPDILEMTND